MDGALRDAGGQLLLPLRVRPLSLLLYAALGRRCGFVFFIGLGRYEAAVPHEI